MIIIFVALILLFGTNKLPEAGKKIGKMVGEYNKAKTALTVAKNVSKFAETIGLTDKNVVDAFTGNFTDKFSVIGKGKTLV